jgi:4-amino-4-deoxy-L-arabinose transferase-like glycosyltransferase
VNSISGHDGRLDSMNPATGTAISGERSRWTEVAAVGPDRWTVASLAAAAASRPVALFLALAVYAFAFQGTRSLWEPDEGRYTAVALEMSRLGDYVIPRLNHESVHLTKPPLTYWLMSISMQVFGQHEWAARLPNALAFIATVLVVAAIGRRITPRAALPAPLVYALSLLPVAAANVISTDTLLTLWETLAVYGFVAVSSSSGWRSASPSSPRGRRG